ncbi:MAG TPA: oligosaccharide flippase family protein [Agriterribacter sp.]|nr:oligosaccharide flippase family protein [Agriterribacter sp.]
MAGIKQLAGQTLWYGVSSIIARLLTYILTPYLTLKLSGANYGDMTLVYAAIPFLNILYTYGLETGYFRFIQHDQHKRDLYNTANVSIISSTILFTVILLLFTRPLAHLMSIGEHPEYVTLIILIVAFDSLATIPFAKLRQDGRPLKYAFVRITGVLLNLAILYFFLSICPTLAKKNPNSIYAVLSSKNFGITFVIVANLVQSIFTLLLLWKEMKIIRWQFNVPQWKELMLYSLPMLIVGLGGMINETLDRLMLGWWGIPSRGGDMKIEIGTYGACYKLAILITVFIQAFRMGAEPFFFKQAMGENPQRTYARVMKFFVIVICAMFLFVALYIDAWKYFIQNPVFWEGLKVVPILLLANMFLGIYYNLSVWYKITNNISAGAWITVGGAVITIIINYLFIPTLGYVASAWATFFCYGSMMVACFIWGQKIYPVPYAWKKLCAYMGIVVLLFFLHKFLIYLWPHKVFNFSIATILLGAFLVFVFMIEKHEFKKLPVVGRWIN